ncbi:MAG: zinc-ribbon domain-containing protein [Candidatus Lokiarchaeota archaeon]|nr:zinc-ribbon domain-containing protein [Candidatus Lokiarchaeota archaeon]
MPRGGGGFGGGFGGGSFRGGGMRGFSGGFRSGSFGSSRPFGRTGAQRIVSSGRSGPYRHSPYGSYYRRRRYYRPWYRTWWYSPFWGRYYRPWYYSPIYVGGGIIAIIMIFLIVLPLMGIAFAFPFSNANANGDVIYRSTETLYFNEYWYEYEYIEGGNEITFSVQSSPSYISFAIWDRSFSNLPYTDRVGSESDVVDISAQYYEYVQVFLKAGSTIEYNYTANAAIDFFIADGYNLNQWALERDSYFYHQRLDVPTAEDIFYVSKTQDYYLVWFNDGPESTVNVEFEVNYTANNVIDISAASYSDEKTTFISEDTFTVPDSGTWYFFIYFDPMNAPEESTTITFDVTYSTGVSGRERWINARPVLIGIIVFIVILITVGFIARKIQKEKKSKEAKKTELSGSQSSTSRVSKIPKHSYTKASPTQKARVSNCVVCGNPLSPNAEFCPYCGRKRQGRKLGADQKTKVVKAKFCNLCGSPVNPNDKFCRTCGAEIVK